MTKAKSKAPQASKQAKQKLVELMQEMEKSITPTAKKAAARTCIRVYCTPF